MLTCLITDGFYMIFISCLQKVKSLFIAEVVFGSILIVGCECDCLAHTFQVLYLLQLNVYLLFMYHLNFFNHQKVCHMLQKFIFSLVLKARMLVQLEDATIKN